jgi:hypothetical protein
LAWTRILSSSGLMFTLTGVTSTVFESVGSGYVCAASCRGSANDSLPPRRRGGRGGAVVVRLALYPREC